MRAHRTRFTRPRIREELARARKTREGVTVIRRNQAGQQLRLELMSDQYLKQKGFCARCDHQLLLSEATFESQEFREDIENRLIHKKGMKCEPVSA